MTGALYVSLLGLAQRLPSLLQLFPGAAGDIAPVGAPSSLASSDADAYTDSSLRVPAFAGTSAGSGRTESTWSCSFTYTSIFLCLCFLVLTCWSFLFLSRLVRHPRRVAQKTFLLLILLQSVCRMLYFGLWPTQLVSSGCAPNASGETSLLMDLLGTLPACFFLSAFTMYVFTFARIHRTFALQADPIRFKWPRLRFQLTLGLLIAVNTVTYLSVIVLFFAQLFDHSSVTGPATTLFFWSVAGGALCVAFSYLAYSLSLYHNIQEHMQEQEAATRARGSFSDVLPPDYLRLATHHSLFATGSFALSRDLDPVRGAGAPGPGPGLLGAGLAGAGLGPADGGLYGADADPFLAEADPFAPSPLHPHSVFSSYGAAAGGSGLYAPPSLLAGAGAGAGAGGYESAFLSADLYEGARRGGARGGPEAGPGRRQPGAGAGAGAGMGAVSFFRPPSDLLHSRRHGGAVADSTGSVTALSPSSPLHAGSDAGAGGGDAGAGAGRGTLLLARSNPMRRIVWVAACCMLCFTVRTVLLPLMAAEVIPDSSWVAYLIYFTFAEVLPNVSMLLVFDVANVTTNTWNQQFGPHAGAADAHGDVAGAGATDADCGHLSADGGHLSPDGLLGSDTGRAKGSAATFLVTSASGSTAFEDSFPGGVQPHRGGRGLGVGAGAATAAGVSGGAGAGLAAASQGLALPLAIGSGGFAGSDLLAAPLATARSPGSAAHSAGPGMVAGLRSPDGLAMSVKPSSGLARATALHGDSNDPRGSGFAGSSASHAVPMDVHSISSSLLRPSRASLGAGLAASFSRSGVPAGLGAEDGLGLPGLGLSPPEVGGFGSDAEGSPPHSLGEHFDLRGNAS